jgi:hypothetical protein
MYRIGKTVGELLDILSSIDPKLFWYGFDDESIRIVNEDASEIVAIYPYEEKEE